MVTGTLIRDHPDSLETELLLNHLIRLRRGEAIECPVYDFSQHNRTRDTIIIRSSRSLSWKESWYCRIPGCGS